MVRILPITLAGCLWIGSAEHEARKAQLAIDLQIGEVSPDAWSACVDEPARFLVEGSVGAAHGGESLEGWFQVDGDERRSLGRVTAGPAQDGRAPIAVTLDLDESLAVIPTCADRCETTVHLGLTRIGLDDDAELAITLLAEQHPTVAGVDLVDADNALHEAATTALDANPADSWAEESWPYLVFELSDPHLPAGLGGTIDACSPVK